MGFSTEMASSEVNNKQVVLKDYITGMPKASHMSLKSTKLPLQLKDGSQDVLAKNLYISCDPYMRGCMRNFPSYFTPIFTPGLVEVLKNRLGFDDAFNYKEESDLHATLKRYFPNGIDIYFENVGGEMLEAVLENMNHHGRIAACGMISEYNREEGRGIRNISRVISKRINIRGFIINDYWERYPQFVEKVRGFIKERKIVYVEDIADGLENAPVAFAGLFEGKNIGKQVVRICDE